MRSLQAWKKKKHIHIPEDIRPLIEETYEESSTDPSAWQSLKKEMTEDVKEYKNKALTNSNILNYGLEDEEGVQTRLSEVPQVTLVLCTERAGNDITLLNGDRISIDSKVKLEVNYLGD